MLLATQFRQATLSDAECWAAIAYGSNRLCASISLVYNGSRWNAQLIFKTVQTFPKFVFFSCFSRSQLFCIHIILSENFHWFCTCKYGKHATIWRMEVQVKWPERLSRRKEMGKMRDALSVSWGETHSYTLLPAVWKAWINQQYALLPASLSLSRCLSVFVYLSWRPSTKNVWTY